jgi:hypothetical protein
MISTPKMVNSVSKKVKKVPQTLNIQTIKKENLHNQVVMELNKLKNQKFQDLLATLDNKNLHTQLKKKIKMKIEMMMVLEIIMKEKIEAIVHTTIVMIVRIVEIVGIEGIKETIEIEENFKKRRIILLILIQISESSILMTRNFTKLL